MPTSTGPNIPTVAVGVPTLNEEANIRAVLASFRASRYPAVTEIFVADGGSTDATRDIVAAIAAEDDRVRLIENPGRIQAAGLNLIIEATGADVLVRADAHCVYSEDYVERCVETLIEKNVMSAGGAQRYVAATPLQAAIALAQRTSLGGGRVAYRDATYDGWSDTVFLGVFWVDHLRAVGGYDLKATNEDVELCLRLRAQADSVGRDPEHAFWTSSAIRVWYFPRDTIRGLGKQYLNYGRGRYRTLRAHPGRVPIRGHAPFLLVVGAGLLAILDVFVLGGRFRLLELLLVFLLLVVALGVLTAVRFRSDFDAEIWRGDDSPPSLLHQGVLCGAVLLLQPLAHALGYGEELVRHRLVEPLTAQRRRSSL